MGPLLFLAVRKRHPRHRRLPEEGGAAGNPSVFDAFVPLLLAALPAAFFISCGHPNLIGTHYQNCRIPYSSKEHAWRRVNGSSNRGDVETSEGGKPQGSFFVVSEGPSRCVGGSVGANAGRFQKYVPNSPRKSYPDLKSANTLSVPIRND